MKTNNILSVLCLVFLCLLGYVAYVSAGDKVTEEYIVKINGIKMQRSCAENLFRYVAKTNNGAIEAYDINDSNVLVQTVTKGMEVVLENELVKAVSELYQNFLNGEKNSFKVVASNEIEQCILSSKNMKGKNVGLNMCIDKTNSVITKFLGY